LWMFDPEEAAYVPMTQGRYDRLVSGGFKF
jgi:hypothetical protein